MDGFEGGTGTVVSTPLWHCLRKHAGVPAGLPLLVPGRHGGDAGSDPQLRIRLPRLGRRLQRPGDTCQVTVDDAAQVTATFRGPQTLEVTVTGVEGGFGQVVYPGGYCENTPGTSQTCASLHAVGAGLLLDVMVPEGHVFVGWSGDCTIAPCAVLMDQTRHVTATFRGPQSLEVTVTGVDGGFGHVVYVGGSCENAPGTSQTCMSLHGVGAVVTLDTMAPEGHAFAGWSGACAGTGPCQVTMDQARQVTATFRGPQTLSVTVTGIDSGVGFVTFAGNSCDNFPAVTITCTYLQPVGQLVTLQATPAPQNDSVFVGWSGACEGTGPCQVTMDQAREVTATFRGPQRLTVTVVSLDGYDARVYVTGGPDCQAAPNTTQTCHYLFPLGAPVTLGYPIPVPISTWGFEGWTGDCTGTGGCEVAMDASRTVTATFRGPQVLTLTVSAADTGIGYVEVEQGGSPRQTCSNQAGYPQPCVYPFGLGEVVTLTPVTGMFSAFVGWSGACTGTGPCQVTMSQSTSVSAVFAHDNQAPTASAGGPYSGVRGDPVTFDGFGWDYEGDALTYSWDFGDGGTGTGPSPTHAYTALGTFTVTLTVHDGQLPSSPSSTTVTITNRPPTAHAGGPYAGVRGQVLAFNGTASSDPDGDALTYAWNFGDGSTGTGATPTHAYATLGTFTVTLTVSDGVGGSAQATSSATITNRAPTASAGGPYSGFRNTAIAFNGSGSSDPDGDPLTYSWNFGDGATGTGANPTHAYATLGTFTVTLVVNDGHANSAPATATVTIANRLPIANAGPDRTVLHRTSVTLDGRGSSDPDGTVVGYQWSQLSGAAVTLSGANTSVATFLAPKLSPGQTAVLVFQLRVTDNNGATATDQVTITVRR